MIKGEHPNLPTQFVADLRNETSRLLREGRYLKKLSLAQAAKSIGVSAFHLKALEDGTINQSLRIVCAALGYYGFNNLEFLELVNELTLEKRMRLHQTRQRKNFSIVGDNPKPWENPPESLSIARERGSRAKFQRVKN